MVEVGTSRTFTASFTSPKNNLQAQFSMEFCLAILLIEGKAGLGEFTMPSSTGPTSNDDRSHPFDQ